MINLIRTEKFRFSYTLLTLNHNNVLMNTRYSIKAAQSDSEAPDPTSTSFLGVYDYINQLNELWFGIGGAYNASEKLGIGVSLFSQPFLRVDYLIIFCHRKIVNLFLK
jgi:hypothetical protein